MKVALCCQWYKGLDCFAESIHCLTKYMVRPRVYNIEGVEVHVLDAQSTNAFNGRNALIYGSNEVNTYKPQLLPYDAWIFFDSDIIFKEKHILDMLINTDSIYMLPYHKKGGNYNVAKLVGERFKHYPEDTKGIHNVDGGGAGALKITREVLEMVKPFAFCPKQISIRDMACILPEDYAFCIKARAAGFEIVCNFDLPVIHRV